MRVRQWAYVQVWDGKQSHWVLICSPGQKPAFLEILKISVALSTYLYKNKNSDMYTKAKGMTELQESLSDSSLYMMFSAALWEESELGTKGKERMWCGISDIRQDLVTAWLWRLWRMYSNVLYTVILQQNLSTVLMASNASSKEWWVARMVQLVDISKVLKMVKRGV